MLLWVEPMMWALCRILGTTMTAVGLIGLLFFTGHGLIRATEYLIDKEVSNEDQD